MNRLQGWEKLAGALSLWAMTLPMNCPASDDVTMLLVSDNSTSYQGFLFGLTDHAASSHYSQLARQLMTQFRATTSVHELTIDGRDHAVALIQKNNLDSDGGDKPIIDDAQRFQGLCDSAKVVIAVGPDSARQVQTCRKPVLLTLLPRYQADALLSRQPNAEQNTAIYLEADPESNLALLRKVLPKAKTVGVLASHRDQALLSELRAKAVSLSLRLLILAAEEDTEAVKVLRRRIDEIDALLLLPETTLVTDWSLKPILLMTARDGVPVFGGLSARYVSAGVTAAVLPKVDRLQQQVQATAQSLAVGEKPEPLYPAETIVIYNKAMVRNLGLNPDHFEPDDQNP